MSNLPDLPLPTSISSSYLQSPSNNLAYHVLSSGPETGPLLLFCHGFPDLAYSWRRLLPILGSHGYYCVAFDQRGYGRTTGHDTRSYSELNLHEYGPLQNIIDVLALVSLLGRDRVDCIIGHDFGGTTAANCALARPEVFKSCIIMSHPFEAIPGLPRNAQENDSEKHDIHAELARLGRKHYKWANATPTAAEEWNNPPQGIKDFLRGYYFVKSASDSRNEPHPLESWTAEELAKMPTYYIPELGSTMADTVTESVTGLSPSMTWLPDAELDVYFSEWTRTGFLPALSWYRSRTASGENEDMQVFAGKKISVPTVFISGDKDWGNWQKPGALEKMCETCSDFRGVKMVKGAGHWVQMEQVDELVKEIISFLGDVLDKQNLP